MDGMVRTVAPGDNRCTAENRRLHWAFLGRLKPAIGSVRAAVLVSI
jgi:hypothetical protein